MTVPSRRVWRAGLPTLLIVGIFAGVVGIALPVLAYLIYRREQTPWLPVVLLVLAVLTLLYAWRFGLHPKIWTRGHVLRIDNPFRRYEFDWDDITLIAPGENGLVVASEDQVAEAWCVQKSTAATRKGRFTRADRIASSLLDTIFVSDRRGCEAMASAAARSIKPGAHIGVVREARRLCCLRCRHDPSSWGRPQAPTTGLRVGATGVRLAGNLRRWHVGGTGVGLGRQSRRASVLPIARLAGHPRAPGL
jgi:hypothetical protein